jgi:hypothetical protein
LSILVGVAVRNFIKKNARNKKHGSGFSI